MEIKEKNFSIVVKTNCNENKIKNFDSSIGAYRIRIKEKAENNKANIKIVKFLSKLMKKKVKIIKGLKSKKKVIKVLD